MTNLLDGVLKAFELIFSGDPRVYEIALRSVFVSGTAILIAALWGIPIAMALGLRNFRGKLLLRGIFNTLMGMPTVLLGLLLYLLLSKSGPLGILHLLYTPTGIIFGQAILITPIIVSLSTTAIESIDPEIMSLAKTLGASDSQASFAVLKEALNAILMAGIAGFNRAIAELGVAQMVGGGIEGFTEVLTTGIALETAKHNLDISIALGFILLAIVFGINITLHISRRKRK